MTKEKLKLSLLDDYIQVIQVNKICVNLKFLSLNQDCQSIVSKILNISNGLLQAYDKLLFKFNLMNISLMVLKRELQFSYIDRLMFNEHTLKKEDYIILLNKIKNINTRLKQKINDLSLNEIEQRYITQNLIGEI